MDFHSLTRRELQALCKKNKIPANMTNVAMADALTALENVEGLEEFMNQSESLEETVPESPSIPRTVNRTSTRRKPITEDPETAQPMTRSRRTTRNTLDKDLDRENQNVNVPDTPAVPVSRRRAPAASASKKMDAQLNENVGQEMRGVVETPVVQTARRRAQAGSARRKVEEGSVQQVYSTRRSVRLLEKTMAELSLNDEGREESLKMDVLDKTEEKDAAAGSLKRYNDTEVSSGASFIKSLNNARELEEDVHQEDKSNENGVEDCQLDNQNSVNMDNLSKTCDELNDLVGENANKEANTNEMEPVDVPVTVFLSERKNASVEVVIEPDDKLSDEIPAKVMEQEGSLPTKASDEIPTEVVEDAAPFPAEPDQRDLEVPLPEDEESEKDSNLLDFKNPEADRDQFVSESNAAQVNIQAAVECVEKESIHHDNVAAPYTFDDPNVRIEDFDTEELVDVNLIEAEVTISYENKTPKLDNPEIVKEEFDFEGLVDVNLIEAEVQRSDEDETSKLDDQIEKEEFDTEGSVDANLTEAEAPIPYENKTPKSAEQIMPSCLGNIPVSTLPIASFSGDTTPGCCPVSGGKFSGKNQLSALGMDSIANQFPRPTQSTPKQSSSKKQATAQKLIITADNKENIDTSGMQVESKKDTVKKNKNIFDEDSLNETSLRQLTKMLKEKMQINNKKKNNEEQNITKPQMGKTRPALQALPENLMLPGESNKEN